jgi:hypothetical protein
LAAFAAFTVRGTRLAGFPARWEAHRVNASDTSLEALSENPDYPLAQTGLSTALPENQNRGVTLAKINIFLGTNLKPTVTTIQSQGTFA